MINNVVQLPAAAQPQVSHESETETDNLAAARGLINATPIALILWGFIIGLLVWVL